MADAEGKEAPSAAADAAGTSDKTKDRLAKMMDGFSEFEGVMRDATRQRRELDTHRLETLKREMGALEKSFTSEVQKREETAKSLQAWAHSQVAELKSHLESLLEDRRAKLQSNIDALNDRVSKLEAQFADDRDRTLKEIQERNADLTAKLEEFQAAFEAERADRLVRESKIQDNLSAHEHETASRFSEEREARDREAAKLRERMDDAILSRSKGDEKFQSFVAAELADIKNAIRREEELREKEDDEIVETMDRYTRKLQASLQIINSADTD